MKTTRHLLALTVFTAMAVSLAFAQELTGKEIMQKVDKREKAATDSFTMRMTLINSGGKKRVREVTAYSKDYRSEKKTVMMFMLPADVKGASYLSLLAEETVDGENCWKIESVPLKKSMYSKYVSWIDKESLVQVKAEFYDEQGTLL